MTAGRTNFPEKFSKFLHKNQASLAFGLIALLSITSIYTMRAATPYGPVFGSDSVTYMTSAQNLVRGNGLGLLTPEGDFRLLPYSPPFYPLVLSLFALFGMDLLQAGFWLNALIYAGLVFLLGWAGWRFLHSGLAAILLAALAACSSVLIEMHLWIMTDPLSLLLGVASLVALALYLDTRSKRAFFLSAALAGLAFLTRYAGVAYCATGVLSVVLLGTQSFRKRLVAAVLYGILACLPMLVWLAIELGQVGSVGSRALLPSDAWLPRAVEALQALKLAVYLWLPYFMQISQKVGQAVFRLGYLALFAGILAAMVYALLRLRKRQPASWRSQSGFNLLATMSIFLVLYLVVIEFVYAAIYPPMSLANRIFAPLHVALLVLFVLVLGILFQQYRHWVPRACTAGLAMLALVAFFNGARAEVAYQARLPMGYNAYQGSAVIDYLRTLPADMPIISNKTSVIQYYLGRPAYVIQEFFSQDRVVDFQPYGSLDDEGQQAFREQGGALVLFAPVREEFAAMYGDQADKRFEAFVRGLYLAYDSPDGQVYFYQAPAP